MENQTFKQQQEDRIEEGKDLKREDELTDISKLSKSELPAEKKSLFSKLSETISSAATTIADKISGTPIVEGHEDLDRDVRKQVKKINKEIQERGVEGAPDTAEWEKALPKKAQDESEGTKDDNIVNKAQNLASAPKEGASLLGKLQQGISSVSDNLKQKFNTEKEEERTEEDDGTKTFKKVDDGFKESVDELKHQKRVEELGQEDLSSKNPFKVLDTGSDNKEEGETRTLGEKIKGGLNDASSKISGKAAEINQKVKGVFEKAPQDKENTQQSA